MFEKECAENTDAEFSMFGLRSVLRSLGVGKLSTTQLNELKVVFKDFAAPSEASDNGLQVYFPEFLLLMGELLKEDFAGLRACSVSVVEAREAERKRFEALVAQVKQEAETTSKAGGRRLTNQNLKGSKDPVAET